MRSIRRIFHREQHIDYSALELSQVAAIIREDWSIEDENPAKPYLDALSTLQSIEDCFYLDSAIMIISGFLENSGTWRTRKSFEIKTFLRKLIEDYHASLQHKNKQSSD